MKQVRPSARKVLKPAANRGHTSGVLREPHSLTTRQIPSFLWTYSTTLERYTEVASVLIYSFEHTWLTSAIESSGEDWTQPAATNVVPGKMIFREQRFWRHLSPRVYELPLNCNWRGKTVNILSPRRRVVVAMCLYFSFGNISTERRLSFQMVQCWPIAGVQRLEEGIIGGISKRVDELLNCSEQSRTPSSSFGIKL